MPVVRVSWFEDKEAKEIVAAKITASIVKHAGTDASYIYGIFEDVKPSDWAGAEKIFGQGTIFGSSPLNSSRASDVVQRLLALVAHMTRMTRRARLARQLCADAVR